MKKNSNGSLQFAVCVDNRGYLASLELHKLYRVIHDKSAAEEDQIRIVDESGEDYLYAQRRFVLVQLPQKVAKVILRQPPRTKRAVSRGRR